jgi:hypothetical protein
MNLMLRFSGFAEERLAIWIMIAAHSLGICSFSYTCIDMSCSISTFFANNSILSLSLKPKPGRQRYAYPKKRKRERKTDIQSALIKLRPLTTKIQYSMTSTIPSLPLPLHST